MRNPNVNDLWTGIVLVSTLGISVLSQASEDPKQACSFLNDSQKIKNCESLFSKIPNKQALTYTLAYMKANTGKLADSACALSGQRPRSSGLSDSKIKGGIQNTCQFVINDVNSSYKGQKYRSNAYMIDLCAGGSSSVVRPFYLNKGTGNGHKDRPGAHTTVLGAFLTSDSVYNFRPLSKAHNYRSMKDSSGKVAGLRLIGLHSSNNDTSHSKPMHVSPYRSSWGCPSTGKENADIIHKLARKGPSLVVNYGDPSNHPLESVNSCGRAGEKSGSRSSSRQSYDDDSGPNRSDERVHEQTSIRRKKNGGWFKKFFQGISNRFNDTIRKGRK